MTAQELDGKLEEINQKLIEKGNELLQADLTGQNLFGQKAAYTAMKESLNGKVDKKSSQLEKV